MLNDKVRLALINVSINGPIKETYSVADRESAISSIYDAFRSCLQADLKRLCRFRKSGWGGWLIAASIFARGTKNTVLLRYITFVICNYQAGY